MPYKDREKKLEYYRKRHQENKYKFNKERRERYYKEKKEENPFYFPREFTPNKEKYWYEKKYPERKKAGSRAYYKKLRDNKCLNCGLNKNLHYHHIDYIKDEGYTLCGFCHQKWHKVLRMLAKILQPSI